MQPVSKHTELSKRFLAKNILGLNVTAVMAKLHPLKVRPEPKAKSFATKLIIDKKDKKAAVSDYVNTSQFFNFF